MANNQERTKQGNQGNQGNQGSKTEKSKTNGNAEKTTTKNCK